ncbi:DNA polymerase Y family protein [Nocardioides sp. AE5]|uniref:DNA polymerase Y family protein n=1 Tax=Nocardioides sp. AE5 TaxID=2962573 RepID=UPI0028825542|nr:DNA polymerase Y family protein [Nocardioides sp. AE5]MDT0200920.1 DNA polymerase Y family protein [Nocardioides sp. AE5]
MSAARRTRTLVLWCPDWMVVAALADADLPRGTPAAVLAKGGVAACNDAARAEGVRRGMRRRDAQSRCPDLALFDDDPERTARAFEPVIRTVEELRPGVAPMRPGLLALRAPGRFYGGEAHAAAIIAERVVEAGVWDCRIGIADDLFTAEQAARRAEQQDNVVVPVGGAARFLGPLPVDVLDDPETVSLLRRLGLHTLGDLAALPAGDVQGRFGAYGARIHRLARGDVQGPLAGRVPPPDLDCEVTFEPPLASIETVCMSTRRTADRFVAQLAERHLVATAVRIEIECDAVIASARSWVHASWFGSVDLIDRVHWQLRGQPMPGPVGRLRLLPETVEPAADHAETLLGGNSDERVARGIAKVQALLGHDAVVAPVLQGGRSPAERQALVPWGTRPVGLRPRDLPWPGSIPPPAPTRVLAEPWPAAVVDQQGGEVRVSDRGMVARPPAWFRPDRGVEGPWQPVSAWAGPWPVETGWWEPTAGASASTLVVRFQVVGVDGTAWLMRCQGGQWWTEAGYE